MFSREYKLPVIKELLSNELMRSPGDKVPVTGSYVFLWTSNRQERTHTWFNMFCNEKETEAVPEYAALYISFKPDSAIPADSRPTAEVLFPPAIIRYWHCS
jgi:hypothetical protein